jgi:polysaccharide pyruvyl transferase WcaK-like protein
MLQLARKKGASTVLLANGLGPLTKNKNRKAASKILNNMDAITLRDSNAYDELLSLNVTKPITKIAADPALALENRDSTLGLNILKSEGIPTDKKIIALCPRKWKKVKNADKILAFIADKIVTDFNAIPVFIEMQHPNDVYFSKKVLRIMKQKGYVLTRRYNVDETLSILSNTDMIVGMRLHSLIYAANLGVPMVGLAYEQKVGFFMDSINQPYVEWNEKFNMNDLIANLHDVWTNLEGVKEELKKIKPILKKKVTDAIDLTLSLLSD